MDYAFQLYQQKQYLQAFRIYRKFAKEGNVIAQYNLGIMYANAQGVKNNDQHAVYCYQKAADQGYASAQNNLGWMYGNGRGVENDDQKAVFWYRKAADQGNETARVSFITLYKDQQTEKPNEALIDLYHEAIAFGVFLDANICYKMLFERSCTELNNKTHSVISIDNSHHLDNSIGFKKYKEVIDEYHDALAFGDLEIAKDLYIELDKYQRNLFRVCSVNQP